MLKSSQSKQISFKGEKIFIGIDAHLRQWHVSVRTKYVTKAPFSQNPDAAALLAYLEREFPEGEYHSAYEAGYCGFHIHRSLVKLGIHNIVFNPADISDTHKERCRKSDSIDCAKISRNLMNGDLTAIYVPSEQIQADRELLSYRQTKIKSKTRTKNRVKSLLAKYNIPYPDEFKSRNSHWTKAFRKWLRELADKSLPPTAAVVMKGYVDSLDRLQNEVNLINRQINNMLKAHYPEMDLCLRSVPGIGRLCSAFLCAYIADINRFETDDKLAGYIGLVPDVRGSDKKQTVLGVTNRGNRLLRPIIIEAAWMAVRVDPAMTMSYTNYRNRGMQPNNAIIRIARKLVNRIRYVLRTGNQYDKSVVK